MINARTPISRDESNSNSTSIPYFSITALLGAFIGICLEWFLYGLYSGIFVMYLKCQSDKSRKATIVFYALCLLHVLSTATIISDLLSIILQLEYVKNGGTESSEGLAATSYLMPGDQTIFPLAILQTLASGACDFIAQCIMIYRCWMVWGQNILVVIIPSLLAITYIVVWIGSEYQLVFFNPFNYNDLTWYTDKWTEGSMGFNPIYPEATNSVPPDPLIVTSFALSMVVNALATGLIVIKIFKVFLDVKRASSLGAAEGTKLRPIIFIIIESGVALFAIQLVRIVYSCLPLQPPTLLTFNLIIGINQMFNGIAPTIILVRVSMRLPMDDNESFKEAIGSLCFKNPPSDPNTLLRVPMGSSSSMQLQESPEGTQTRRSEDICCNNPPSGASTLRQMKNSCSMLPEERIENTSTV